MIRLGNFLLLLTLLIITPAQAQMGLSDTIAVIKPAIVMVGTHSNTGNPAFHLMGSGFSVGANLVATNAHVVATAQASAPGSHLVIRLAGGNESDQLRRAKVIGSDPIHDLSILRVDGAPLSPLQIGDSTKVKEGDAIAFTGFPIGGVLGFSPVTHRGIVSAITSIAPPSQNGQGLTGQRVRAIRSGGFDVFQLDATAYPGNSGGPLFDPAVGTVIGVINMVFVKGSKEAALSQPSGITYAIPAIYLKELLQAIGSSVPTTPPP